MFGLHPLDLATLVIYLLGITVIGLLASRTGMIRDTGIQPRRHERDERSTPVSEATTQTPPASGVFCWNELMTTDPAAAKTFYTQLLGWATEEKDMGDKDWMTPRARAFETWCLSKSWRMCGVCHRMVPVKCTAAHLREKDKAPPEMKKCKHCAFKSCKIGRVLAQYGYTSLQDIALLLHYGCTIFVI